MKLLLTRRTLLGVLALLVLAGWAGTTSSPRLDDTLHIVVLHTNDIHGQVQPRPALWIDRDDPPLVGGIARVAQYVHSVREEHRGPNKGVLVVDGGDWFQGTPEGLIDHGRAFMGAMARVGYDAMAVGNHDMDHGIDHLRAMIADLDLPAVSANLRNVQGGERVDWVEPWRIVEVAGLRVGIVGLLTPTTPSITHADARTIRFEDPAETIAQAKLELGERVDWVLPITHLGVVSDRRLVKATSGLELVVGGHSHTYLKAGVRQGESFIVQAGSKASAVGRVDLFFDAETKELKELKYEMIDLYEPLGETALQGEVSRIGAELARRSDEEMSRPVGELLLPMTRSHGRCQSAPAGNLICDVMREHSGAQVAIQNRGGIRSDLQAGEVTRRGLFEILPFGNHLVLLEISGADLVGCLRAAVEGTAHTGLEISGMSVDYRKDSQGRYELVVVKVAGELIDPEGTYRLVTNSFLADGGDGYEFLKSCVREREDPTLLREMLEAHFAKEGQVRPSGEDRYIAVD